MSQVFASHLLANLVRQGVTNYFLAPGSRSQSLAIAISQLEAAGKAKAVVRLDERSLGFTALGHALASGSPAALVVTSGTAVANLHPAVLEAHHSSVPLLILSADRPASLRGKGANQTTNQVGLFGSAAVCIDVPIGATPQDAHELGTKVARHFQARSGPLQLNLQFAPPLSASEPNAAELAKTLQVTASEEPVRELTQLSVPVDDHTVVVAGSSGERAREFAEAANLPLLAEPSSGARAGRCASAAYLSRIDELGDQVRKVVVFGKPTLSRKLLSLIEDSTVYFESSSRHGLFDPFDSVIASAERLTPDGKGSDQWVSSWKAEPEMTSRGAFVSEVWNRSDSLVLGASDLIRQLDQVATPKEIAVYSNRGLSGIDGVVSTAIGVALAKGPTTALIGDLTLLHESGGLNLTGLAPELRIVVGNDRGGEIFKKLEIAQTASPEVLERFFTTPQRVDIEGLANAYGWQYVACKDLGDLAEAWPLTGPVILDYLLD